MKKRFLSLLLSCQLISLANGQTSKTSFDAFLGTGFSTVKTQEFEVNPYFYDFLPVVSWEGGVRGKYQIARSFSATGSIGYSKTGFEGRHFVRINTDTIFQFQEETWSKFHFHNLFLSGGLSYNYRKIVAADVCIKGFLLIKGIEKARTVELSDFYAQNFIGASKRNKAQDFNSLNWGIDFGIQHWLSSRISVEIRAYFARTDLRPVKKYEHRLEGRGLQFRTLFTIFS